MQFPYEIWSMIVSYLPVAHAKLLYSVNSVLFDIAMDLRYQEARLWTGTPKARVRKDLRVFCHPHLASRPKALHINLTSIAKSLSSMDREGPSLGQIFLNLVTTGQYEQPGSIPEIFTIALDALPRLTAVTKLSIEHDYTGAWRDDPLVQQVITHIWQNLGDQLRILQIRAALENFELLLPASIHLPHLEVLAVNAEGYSRPANAGESIISTMIQSHSSTLRDVSFTTKNTAINFRHISRTLESLPRLQAVHLSLPFGPLVPRPFPAYKLLRSCEHHLEVLSLDFKASTHEGSLPSSSIFGEDWCYFDLPRVRDLRIKPPKMVFGQEFVEYIHRFAPSLISLSIKPHCSISFRDAEHLSSIFHDFLFLRNLSLEIICLSPDILALFARTLPHLRTLDLQYYSLSHTTDLAQAFHEDRELPRFFYLAMKQHTDLFSEWQLVSFDHHTFSSIHPPSAKIEKALVDHLPNVVWFCGNERSAYLSQSKKPPPTPTSPVAMSLAMLNKIVPTGRIIDSLISTHQ